MLLEGILGEGLIAQYARGNPEQARTESVVKPLQRSAVAGGDAFDDCCQIGLDAIAPPGSAP